AAPGDTVFVYARSAQGLRMPLAIVRKQVSDLPFDFVLDDSSAMSSAARLSTAGKVVVSARISKSGQAVPQSGDLEAESAPLDVGARGIALVIDKRVP
ncbi:MAG: c-type cytochrome biogenesis protein CcmI, partial [Pseudomonadota bacterium]|nr:c-type cytochrome biogenesis protein CcmI [Pseudomonadota bacterium]